MRTVGRVQPAREAAILAFAFASAVLGAAFHVDDTFGPPTVAGYAVAVVLCAALPLRHRTPLAALAVATACGLLVAPLGLLLTPLVVVPVGICAYHLALRDDRRAADVAVLASPVLLVSTTLLEPLSWQDASRLGVVAAVPLLAGVLGRSSAHRRAYLGAVEERARLAESTRESEARSRVAEERVRIARELHDVVAHQITLANAQAMVAVQVFDSRPDQARAQVGALVDTTRNALDDLRATVGLLRESDDATSSVEPAPGLGRLPALVESFDRAGLAVWVEHEGTVRDLPPGLDLTAFRIIQEALTNVAKHAGTGQARVRIGWGREQVRITVTDDGWGTPTAPDRPPGYGLIGMRERATAVGGQLSAHRRPEGGFLVTSHLPLPPLPVPAYDAPADGGGHP